MIVKYSKKFPYAPYLNEDIGFETTIDDSVTEEQIMGTLKKLSQMALKFHQENNPQLDFGLTDASTVTWEMKEGSIPKDRLSSRTLTMTTIPTIDHKKKDETEIAIDNATTLEELDLLMGDAAKYGLHKQLLDKRKTLQ